MYSWGHPPLVQMLNLEQAMMISSLMACFSPIPPTTPFLLVISLAIIIMHLHQFFERQNRKLQLIKGLLAKIQIEKDPMILMKLVTHLKQVLPKVLANYLIKTQMKLGLKLKFQIQTMAHQQLD